MAEQRQSPREQFKQVLDFIHKGKLFALQEWIRSGKPLHAPKTMPRAPRLICSAVRSGFHSIVEELLRAQPWPPKDLADALKDAQSRRRYDIADLLLNCGAEPKKQDFETVCQAFDLTMMERQLRAGVDPNQNNVFARVLSTTKARPLLRFFRSLHQEFPALEDQASLALAEAVHRGEIRWVALLAWAGADPFRPVPHDLDGTFPVDPDNSTSAATNAIWRDKPEILKLLRLKPNPCQALALLSTIAYRGNAELFRTFLTCVPTDQLNTSPRGSCEALEEMVSRSPHRDLYSNNRDGKGDPENLQCIELLLDAGARWNPPSERLRYIRRGIMKHDPRYIVQLLRLLLYTPKAANAQGLLELCRSQSLLAKIATVDLPLVQEIKGLRAKSSPFSISSPSSAAPTASVAPPGAA